MEYLPRALAQRVRQTTAPVAILEGPRGVGKTTFVRNGLDRSLPYTTLVDRSTAAQARSDPLNWLRSLGPRAIIDEAQLAPDLPLALKEHVDTLGTEARFVITGSASIPQDQLGGSHPLVRRVERFELQPFTAWELAGGTDSPIDKLFDGPIAAGQYREVSLEELFDRVLIGGFPGYALTARQELPRRPDPDVQVRRTLSDIDTLLTQPPEGTGAPTLNPAKARDVIRSVLCNPAQRRNISDLGRESSINTRTLVSYLDRFRKLFLIHELPNLARQASDGRRQAHPRVLPVDVSLSVAEFINAGTDPLGTPLGAVFEAYAAQQLIAMSTWNPHSISASYWYSHTSRPGNQPAEVDLVLTDSSGRHVGFEMKASIAVDPRDIAGLQAFRASKKLHRGFVVYRGAQLLPLDPGIWALPIAALLDG